MKMPDTQKKNGSVYFLAGCDADIVKNHLDVIVHDIKSKDCNSAETQVVCISRSRKLTSLAQVEGYPQFFVTLCRRYNLLKNDRVTLLSPMDHLIAIQLCLAEKNKQDMGDFDVETSMVLQASKDITNKKLLDKYDVTSCTKESGICDLLTQFLDNCSYTDSSDVFLKIKREVDVNEDLRGHLLEQSFIILDTPKTLVEKQMAELLCRDKDVKRVNIEVPLSNDDSITVSIDNTCLATMLETEVALSTVKKPPSVTEVYVRLVYLSYLDLLVNSRSELALARVFNVPERELTHEAFTALKHESQQKKMTMYQTLTSFIMKIKLGGKGYAPNRDSSLGPFVKGLGDLVSLMHRLETVVEEDPDIRSACRRVVNIIKREMLKCRDSKIRKSSVEAVAEDLHSQVEAIIDSLDAVLIRTPDKAPANGGSLTSRHARKALRHLLDKLATVDDDISTLDHLTDIYSSQRTPLRFPSVMSQFRSPEDELEVTSPENKFNQSLSDRVASKINKQPTPVYMKRYKSSLDWADPVHSVQNSHKDDIFSDSQVFVIPSKTIVHAGSKFSSGEANRVLESMLDQENVNDNIELAPVSAVTNSHANKEKKHPKNADAGKSKKRQIKTNVQSSQPAKKKKQEQSKTCRRKLLPQVKGQKQLTHFFRI